MGSKTVLGERNALLLELYGKYQVDGDDRHLMLMVHALESTLENYINSRLQGSKARFREEVLDKAKDFAFRRLKHYNPQRQPLIAYISTLVFLPCVDAIRSVLRRATTKVHKVVAGSKNLESKYQVGFEETPPVDFKEEIEPLLKGLSTLEKDIVYQYFWRGTDMKTIGEIQNYTESRISQILDSAMRRLKKNANLEEQLAMCCRNKDHRFLSYGERSFGDSYRSSDSYSGN